ARAGRGETPHTGHHHRGLGTGPTRPDRPHALLHRGPVGARSCTAFGVAACVVTLDHPRGAETSLRHLFLRRRTSSRAEPPGRGGRGRPESMGDPALVGEEWFAGRIPMLAPTVATCVELAQARTLEGVWSTERDIVPIEPEMREIDGRLWAVLPSGTSFPLPEDVSVS